MRTYKQSASADKQTVFTAFDGRDSCGNAEFRSVCQGREWTSSQFRVRRAGAKNPDNDIQISLETHTCKKDRNGKDRHRTEHAYFNVPSAFAEQFIKAISEVIP